MNVFVNANAKLAVLVAVIACLAGAVGVTAKPSAAAGKTAATAQADLNNLVCSGGVYTKAKLLYYARGGKDPCGRQVAAIWASMGITLGVAETMHSGTVCSNDQGGWISSGHEHGPKPSEDTLHYASDGQTFYARPLSVWGTTCYDAWVGYTEDGHEVAVLKNCGNGECKKFPPKHPATPVCTCHPKPKPKPKPKVCTCKPKPAAKAPVHSIKYLETYDATSKKWVNSTATKKGNLKFTFTLYRVVGPKLVKLRSAAFGAGVNHNWGRYNVNWQLALTETRSASGWTPVLKTMRAKLGKKGVTFLYWNKPVTVKTPPPVPPPPAPGPSCTNSANGNGQNGNCSGGSNCSGSVTVTVNGNGDVTQTCSSGNCVGINVCNTNPPPPKTCAEQGYDTDSNGNCIKKPTTSPGTGTGTDGNGGQSPSTQPVQNNPGQNTGPTTGAPPTAPPGNTQSTGTNSGSGTGTGTPTAGETDPNGTQTNNSPPPPPNQDPPATGGGQGNTGTGGTGTNTGDPGGF